MCAETGSVLAIGVAICGCNASSGGAVGAKPDHLTIAASVAADTLDPATTIRETSLMVLPGVLDTLLTPSPTGTLEPSLASSDRVDPFNRLFEFTLDLEARFSNGTPVTSSDVAFWVEMWRAATTYGAFDSSIASASTTDPQDVVLNLKSAGAAFTGILAIPTSSISLKDTTGRFTRHL